MADNNIYNIKGSTVKLEENKNPWYMDKFNEIKDTLSTNSNDSNISMSNESKPFLTNYNLSLILLLIVVIIFLIKEYRM